MNSGKTEDVLERPISIARGAILLTPVANRRLWPASFLDSPRRKTACEKEQAALRNALILGATLVVFVIIVIVMVNGLAGA